MLPAVHPVCPEESANSIYYDESSPDLVRKIVTLDTWYDGCGVSTATTTDLALTENRPQGRQFIFVAFM